MLEALLLFAALETGSPPPATATSPAPAATSPAPATATPAPATATPAPAIPTSTSTTSPDQPDLIMQAMSDELARSMTSLKLANQPAPHYIRYQLRDSDTFHVETSQGALIAKNRIQARDLDIDLRVGTYKLDSSEEFQHTFSGVTIDDDYDAIRRDIWENTDIAYKRAVEDYHKKVASIKEQIMRDVPDSMSKEEPVVLIEPKLKLVVDESKWTEITKRLSRALNAYPKLKRASVDMVCDVSNRYLINNEGFKHRVGDERWEVTVCASSQAEDGAIISDVEVFAANSENRMPTVEAMEEKVKALGQRVTESADAKSVVFDYSGPVLLEGQAAAEFFVQVLVPHLANIDIPPSTSGTSFPRKNPLSRKLGRRILPTFINITDDPFATEYKGTPLVMGYALDSDGMRPIKLKLVEHGMLKTLCASRMPSRQIKNSNGHAGYNGQPEVTSLFVTSELSKPTSELKQQLIDKGRELGLDYVLIVRRSSGVLQESRGMLDNSISAPDQHRAMTEDIITNLFPPLSLYRVSVKDGTEELVRGVKFYPVTHHVLKDILATGDDDAAYLTDLNFAKLSHIITPSILLEELDLEPQDIRQMRPPVLGNPRFAKGD